MIDAQSEWFADETAELEAGSAKARPSRRVFSAEEQALRGSLVEALRAANGNVARVARALDKAPMQVHRWMKRLGIDPKPFRHGRGTA